MNFADNLNALLEIAGKRVRLHDVHGVECGVIENAPGTGGSFRVYAELIQRYGSITSEAAVAGVTLFAEHAEDARQHPGKHPNIDRLFVCIDTQTRLDASIECD